MYYNETKRKIIFLFIYIDSFFIYTIYSRYSSKSIYSQFTYLSFEHNHIIISQYVIIKQNYHIIISTLYQHIIISSLSKIIILSSSNKIIISFLSKIIILSYKYHHHKLQNYHRRIHNTKEKIIINYRVQNPSCPSLYKSILHKKTVEA